MIEINKWQEPITSSIDIPDSVLHISISMVDFTCFYTDVNFCYQYKKAETNPTYGYVHADDIFNIEGMASTLVYTVVTIPIMVIGSIILAFLSDILLAT